MLKALSVPVSDPYIRNSNLFIKYRKLDILINKIKWYPFNMVACNIVSTSVKIVTIGYGDSNVTMFFVGMVTMNLLGFVDSIAYFLTPSVQTAWLNWYEYSVLEYPILSVLCCNCCILKHECQFPFQLNPFVTRSTVTTNRTTGTTRTSRATELTHSRSTAGNLSHVSSSHLDSSLFSEDSDSIYSTTSDASDASDSSDIRATQPNGVNTKNNPSNPTNPNNTTIPVNERLRPGRISRSMPAIHAWNMLLINDIIEGEADVDMSELEDDRISRLSRYSEDSSNTGGSNSGSNTVNQMNPIQFENNV